MPIATNSYGSVAEIVALTRLYLKGQTTYNSTTIPRGTEVEKFIDRASGVLNLALMNGGFAIPITQADAKLACDDWVVTMAAAYVEAAQPFEGLEENSREITISRLGELATKFVHDNQAGFGALGVSSQPGSDSNAVVFTGETAFKDRTDPTNTGLEQPKFLRGQFDS